MTRSGWFTTGKSISTGNIAKGRDLRAIVIDDARLCAQNIRGGSGLRRRAEGIRTSSGIAVGPSRWPVPLRRLRRCEWWEALRRIDGDAARAPARSPRNGLAAFSVCRIDTPRSVPTPQCVTPATSHSARPPRPLLQPQPPPCVDQGEDCRPAARPETPRAPWATHRQWVPTASRPAQLMQRFDIWCPRK